MTAQQVMKAVYWIYSSIHLDEMGFPSNDEYAQSKTNNFMRRIGINIDDDPNQEVSVEAVKRVAWMALDNETEKKLFAILKI